MAGEGIAVGERTNGGFFLAVVVGWRGGVRPVHLLVDKWTSAVPPLPITDLLPPCSHGLGLYSYLCVCRNLN